MKKKFHAYTLVEVLITTFTVSIILAGVMTEYVSLLKGYETMNTYRDLHSQARAGVDQFTRDLRGASSITAGSSNAITFLVPVVGITNTITGTNTITYAQQSNTFVRTMVSGGATNTAVMARDVEAIDLTYYLRDGITQTASPSMAFNVHGKVTCSRGVAGAQKVDFIQTRTLLRNKHS